MAYDSQHISSRERAARIRRAPRHRSTYIVEALLLLACVLVVVSVVMVLLGAARASGVHTARLQQAVALAENAAERFAANPANLASTPEESDGYRISYDVDVDDEPAGSMLTAHIRVSYAEEELYELECARYVSQAEARERGLDAASPTETDVDEADSPSDGETADAPAIHPAATLKERV